jgi:hypothetical protein
MTGHLCRGFRLCPVAIVRVAVSPIPKWRNKAVLSTDPQAWRAFMPRVWATETFPSPQAVAYLAKGAFNEKVCAIIVRYRDAFLAVTSSSFENV